MSRKTIAVSNCRFTEETEMGVAHGADHGVTSRSIGVTFTDSISARRTDTGESAGEVEGPVGPAEHSLKEEASVLLKGDKEVSNVDVEVAWGVFLRSAPCTLENIPNTPASADVEIGACIFEGSTIDVDGVVPLE